MSGIFKAYDVRGIYPTEINEAIAEQIGRAFWHVLAADGFPGGKTVVVSRDMRSSSAPLEAELRDEPTVGRIDLGGLLRNGIAPHETGDGGAALVGAHARPGAPGESDAQHDHERHPPGHAAAGEHRVPRHVRLENREAAHRATT